MLCHRRTANTKSYITQCWSYVCRFSYICSVRTSFTYTFSKNIFPVRLNPETSKERHVTHSYSKKKHQNVFMLGIYILFTIHERPSSLCVLMYLRFPCYDLTSNGCLYSDFKHLSGYGVFESLAHGFPCAVRTVSADKTHPSEPFVGNRAKEKKWI